MLAGAQTTGAETDIIEGAFRLVAERPLNARRPSPNRRRRVARILFWNAALAVAVVGLPLLR